MSGRKIGDLETPEHEEADPWEDDSEEDETAREAREAQDMKELIARVRARESAAASAAPSAPVKPVAPSPIDTQTPPEPAPAPDPLQEDARTADSGRALVKRIEGSLDDLEWRQAARNKQAQAMAIQEDLDKSPAALRAEWKAKARKPRSPPESARAAKQFLGRILAKCEEAMDDALEEKSAGASRFSLAAQIAHAAVKLAHTMDRIGVDTQRTRHTVKVERETPRRKP